ncbi:GNAT family N-acetyltransferase [Paenibacillus sediminis]|uniref:Phosphinothricin acetyltransferase n=1 Tax=Paenibacillus sediminis TaxID=664909 RepID=A0ABS4H278_9BACL|nr:GNAT family N-acetyltransferase [Paenibacillus sediminis]MBP1936220.1 phosphinothricin acetyltransferase [Paenibacillus sediminis]
MLSIREAQLNDLPEMLDIYNEAIRNLVSTFDLEEQTLEQRTVWFQKYGGKYPLIVAELDSQIVGYCCLSSFREKPAYSRTAELSLYIADGYRGQGIGSTLLKEIIDRAKQLSYHTIIAGITGGNEESVKLHLKYGFEFIGTFREVGYKFGAWRDVMFYQLLLE